MLDDYLIHYCAPALAGLKPANLFACAHQTEKNPKEAMKKANKTLNGKGVFLEVLRQGQNSTLILLYRKTQLEALLQNEKAAEILIQKGYPVGSAADCIELLKSRISGGSFPHEIGVLLGYPAEDVAGFITNGGANSRYDGCWKVYTDVTAAKSLFAQYKKTTESYINRHLNGASVSQLTMTS